MKRNSPPVTFPIGSFVDWQRGPGDVRRGVKVRSLPFQLADDTWMLHLEGSRQPVALEMVRPAQLANDDTPEELT